MAEQQGLVERAADAVISPWGPIVAAATVRVAAWWEWRAWPGSAVAILDPAWHEAWGHRILTESWLGGTTTWQVAPGAAYLFAAGELLFGAGTGVAAAVQLALGVLAVAALYALGRRAGGRSVGVITAYVAAFSSPFVFHDLAQLGASPAIAAFAAAIALVLASDSPRRVMQLVLAGLLLGAACWFRPNLLLVSPILALAALPWPPSRKGAGLAGLVLLGTALAFVPSFARNLAVGGEPVLLSANGGVNLAMAQRPGLTTNMLGAASARNLGQLTEDSLAEASRALGHPAKPGEADRWWQQQARAAIAADPAGFVSRTIRRFALALSTIDVQDHYTFHAWRRDRPWLGALLDPTFLVPGLALVGAGARVRRPEDQRTTVILLALWLGGAASLAPFVVVERYRIPLAAVSLVLAVCGLVEILRQRRLEWAVLAVVLSLIASLDPFGGRWVLPDTLAGLIGPLATSASAASGTREADEASNIGAAFLKLDRPEGAIPFYRRALQLDPDRAGDAHALGAALLRQGDVAGSVGVLAAAAKRHPENVDLALGLCTALMQAPKQRMNAAGVCQHAQDLAPDRWDVNYQTAMARWQAGDLFRAERDLHKALEQNPGFELGRKAMQDLQREMRATLQKTP